MELEGVNFKLPRSFSLAQFSASSKFSSFFLASNQESGGTEGSWFFQCIKTTVSFSVLTFQELL